MVNNNKLTIQLTNLAISVTVKIPICTISHSYLLEIQGTLK